MIWLGFSMGSSNKGLEENAIFAIMGIRLEMAWFPLSGTAPNGMQVRIEASFSLPGKQSLWF
jgi:hypothetical protein